MKSEQVIQHEISEFLRSRGYFVTKLIATTTNGIPDLLAVKNGNALFVEVKSEKGILSKLQKFRIDELNEYAVAIVARSVSDVERTITSMEMINPYI